MTDNQHARRITDLADELNAAIRAAKNNGLTIVLDIRQCAVVGEESDVWFVCPRICREVGR